LAVVLRPAGLRLLVLVRGDIGSLPFVGGYGNSAQFTFLTGNCQDRLRLGLRQSVV
jgi:hypothetical protein